MSRISDILTRARDTLADHSGDRWSDERLIRLIDEAQKDICRRAKLLRTKSTIPICNYTVPEIELPDNLMLLDRVLYNDGISNNLLEFKSHLQLDKDNIDWESDIGSPIYVIYDKQSKKRIKLYPIPSFIDADTYEVTNIIGSYSYGMIVDITGDDTEYLTDTLGVTTSLNGLTNDFEESFSNGIYGVTSGICETASSLIIYYLRKPSTIRLLTDTLEIDDIYDNAIKYYITGKALRDDMDTQNRVVGNEELQFYDRELKEAIKDDVMDFTRNSNKQYEAIYNSGFN